MTIILKYNILYGLISMLMLLITDVHASAGDRSPYYQKCVDKCSNLNCTDGQPEFYILQYQPFYMQLLQWSCSDECRYMCMWKTVNSFLERDWEVPQFHGKWPFVRLFGLQEPASVLFSLLNLAAHYHMLKRFRLQVRKNGPMYWMWHTYALVCLNGWFWSCVFHARDFPFTEKMDYFCAFSMVLFSFYTMCARVLNGRFRLIQRLLVFLCCGFFVHHISYLTMVRFDYGYNMAANIVVGVSNALGWLVWCLWHRKRLPHVWRCATFVLLAGVSMLFEVADFPPYLWLVDAHSLWHLGTAGLPFIFYRFLIDDCKYLGRQEDFYDAEKLHRS